MSPLRQKTESDLPTEIAEILPPESPISQKLSPENPKLNQSNALEVLRMAEIDQRRGKSRMAPLLVQYGLGLDEIARKLTNFATYSEDETIQFKATEMALKLHGELEKDNDRNAPIVINFGGVSPELMQVLIPRG